MVAQFRRQRANEDQRETRRRDRSEDLRLRGRELLLSEHPQAEAQRDEQHPEGDGVAALKLVLDAYAATVPGFFIYFPSRAQRSGPLRLFVDAAKELAVRRLK